MLGGSFTPREIRIRLGELEFDERKAEEFILSLFRFYFNEKYFEKLYFYTILSIY